MTALLHRANFDALLGALCRHGYAVIGPTVRDGAIVCAESESAEDLPSGWVDDQEAGRYRLRRTADPALFAHTVGPVAWKPFLFPPGARLLRITPNGDGTPRMTPEAEAPPRYALVGVRACDLAAIAVQDAVFLRQASVDRSYEDRRRNAFIVAVHCTRPGRSCFCASTGTGPRATGGFDLALTEICADGRHYFLVEAGSPRGEGILAEVPHRDATPEERAGADELVARAAGLMGRSVDLTDLRDLLYRSYDHPRWDEVGAPTSLRPPAAPRPRARR